MTVTAKVNGNAVSQRVALRVEGLPTWAKGTFNGVVGAVTATLSFDTGVRKTDPKTKKSVAVIYKPTCSTYVIPTTPADSDTFEGEAFVYFAPSPANGFPGFVACVQF